MYYRPVPALSPCHDPRAHSNPQVLGSTGWFFNSEDALGIGAQRKEGILAKEGVIQEETGQEGAGGVGEARYNAGEGEGEGHRGDRDI